MYLTIFGHSLECGIPDNSIKPKGRAEADFFPIFILTFYSFLFIYKYPKETVHDTWPSLLV